MVLVGGLSVQAATVANWIYLPGDLVKVVVAALVARGVHAAYPGLLGGAARRATEATLSERSPLGAVTPVAASWRRTPRATRRAAAPRARPGPRGAVVRTHRLLGDSFGTVAASAG